METAPPDRPRVLVASNAEPAASEPSELVETIPITSERGATRKVVMSLGPTGRGPSRMPDVAPGDRLQVIAEVEVTTDSKRCTTWKVGVLRITESPGRRLFVNLVADSAAPFGGEARGDAMRVLEDGFIEVVRYPPELRG